MISTDDLAETALRLVANAPLGPKGPEVVEWLQEVRGLVEGLYSGDQIPARIREDLPPARLGKLLDALQRLRKLSAAWSPEPQRRGRLLAAISDVASALKLPTLETAAPLDGPEIVGGRWIKGRTLGRGGQAITFRARDVADPRDDWPHVLKLLRATKSPQARERFHREAAFLERVDHPCIVRFADAQTGDEIENPFIVTHRVEGQNLSDLVERRGALPVIEAVEIVLRLADGLETVHRAGIIHRDVKPENVVLDRHSLLPILLDFGISFDPELDRQTHTIEQVGPRFFMAPELRDGRTSEIGPATDLYSLGKVLHFLLSGGGRFDREDHHEDRYDLERRFPDDARYRALNRILDQLIVRRPADRLKSAADLVAQLRRIRALLELGYAPSREGDLCLECGDGTYHLLRPAHSMVLQIPSNKNESAHILPMILMCDACGSLKASASPKDLRAGLRQR